MRLVALTTLTYDGKIFTAGQTFEATDSDGFILSRIGKAEEAPEPEDPIETEEQPAPSKRTYNRRDMRSKT